MHRFPDLASATAYIESFATRSRDVVDALPARERQAARFPEMRDLLALLGDPQVGLRAAHVAGTSGKGSTATILASLLGAAGQRVGLYTNPYVIAPQERIQIAGRPIAEEAFIAAAERVAAAIDIYQQRFPTRHPHLKQVWVALALLAFAQAGVDCAVVETGMGGRFDETNIVQSQVAIITTVDFDHTEFLGKTREEIAWHKAGIIKAGVPVVTGVGAPQALAIVRAEAAQAGASLDVLHETFSVEVQNIAVAGTRFIYHDAQGDLTDLDMPLVGAHQAANAALALRATRVLVPDIAEQTIRNGLGQAWLPGRFEIVAHDPLIVLDVAHNPEKMRALVTTLQQTCSWHHVHIIFGALGAKEVSAMLAILAPLQPTIIATAPTVAGRLAYAAEAIAAEAAALGLPATSAPDPQLAIDQALGAATSEDVILVTGSLFLVSQVRPRWRGP